MSCVCLALLCASASSAVRQGPQHHVPSRSRADHGQAPHRCWHNGHEEPGHKKQAAAWGCLAGTTGESQRDTDPLLPPGRGSSLSQDSVICAARPPGLRARGQCARPWPRPERPSAEGGPRPAASDTSLYLPHSALGLSIPICTGAGPDDRAL